MKRIGITLALMLVVAQAGGIRDFDSLRAWLHPVAVQAGHPACDPNQPKRAPCKMGSCTQMDKDGNPTGAKCSSYCAQGCCGCDKDKCHVDYPGTGPNPDEENPEK